MHRIDVFISLSAIQYACALRPSRRTSGLRVAEGSWLCQRLQGHLIQLMHLYTDKQTHETAYARRRRRIERSSGTKRTEKCCCCPYRNWICTSHLRTAYSATSVDRRYSQPARQPADQSDKRWPSVSLPDRWGETRANHVSSCHRLYEVAPRGVLPLRTKNRAYV